jgi:hypothetical protein
MMGRREGGQGQFFYSFDLDKVVPCDHVVRQIDGVLDLGWVHKELAPCARAASGHATIAPPIAAINSRRPMSIAIWRAPRNQGKNITPQSAGLAPVAAAVLLRSGR